MGANSPTVSHPSVPSNSHQIEPNISSKCFEDLRKYPREKKKKKPKAKQTKENNYGSINLTFDPTDTAAL